MTNKQLRTMAGKLLEYLMVSGEQETHLRLPKAITDKQCDYLYDILRRFNVDVDFNQLYDEKTNKIKKDRKTLLVGVGFYDN